MADMEQDDIDKLLSEALGGDDDEAEEAPIPEEKQAEEEPAEQGAEEPAPEEPPAPDQPAPGSQEEIDALVASAADQTGEAEDEAPAAQPEAAASEEAPPAQQDVESQDDIDALLASVESTESAEAEQAEAPPAGEPAPAEPADETPEAPPEAEAPEPAAGHDEAGGADNLAALVQEGDAATAEEPPAAEEAPAEEAPAPPPEDRPKDTEEPLADDMMPQEAEAAPAVMDKAVSPPEEKPEAEDAADALASSAITQVLQKPETEGDQAQETEEPAPEPAPEPEPAADDGAPPPAEPKGPPVPPMEDVASIQQSLSLAASASEVEGLAGQISSLLGDLSERAKRFQTAWHRSDQEAKEHRAHAADLSHRLTVTQEEKKALEEEVADLRNRLTKLEGQKLGGEESNRTKIASLELKLREQESRGDMLDTEVEALKEELNKARSESTGSDLESRRARFEMDRLRSELDAERMERMRIQRALDNREKELQSIQAQTAGQASSLFLDELHRLVRRLENEMDIRTSAAHEALAAVDRMKVPEELVAVVSNLRTALLTAAGLTDGESEDALRSLSDQAAKPGDAVQPVHPSQEDEGKASLAAFESALVALDMDKAHDLARTLLRKTYTTPAHLMSKIYLCSALRQNEVGTQLHGVIKLLQDLKATQEAADRTRGREGPETERMLVQMFDYLHNLVRLKHVSRTTGEAWQFFLDLRGRYSFVTSDKQWAEYRDRVLSSS